MWFKPNKFSKLEISRCPHVFLIYQDGLYMDLILFSRNMYLLIFCVLHSVQIITILLVKVTVFKSSNTIWENIICSVEQSHYPFPSEDWDTRKGGCVDHIKRQMNVQKEFLVMTIINLAFNIVLLFPLLILCKIFWSFEYLLWSFYYKTWSF